MQLNSWMTGVLLVTSTLVACADRASTTARENASGSQPTSINACDDGVEACEGNARCESCLVEGACASGPDPVWTGDRCVCTDDEPANCVYEFCCAIDFEWDPVACACLPCGDEEEAPHDY